MSDTSRLLADNVQAFLARHPGAACDETFMEAVRESGFALAMAPEELGGLQCSLAEAATVARVWGYQAAPLPIVELLLSGFAARIKPDLVLTTTFMPRGGGERLAAWFPGVERCVDLSGAGSTIAPVGERSASTTLATEPLVAVTQDAMAGSFRLAGDDLLPRGALLTAARMLGAMERVLELTVEHVTLRQQFGRPIARFQLVQAMAADAASEVAASRAVIGDALAVVDHGETADLLWRAAKIQAARAATLVSAHAHQMFGAIGFTEEHELHRFTTSLLAWRNVWGSTASIEKELGGLACTIGGDGLWGAIAGN